MELDSKFFILKSSKLFCLLLILTGLLTGCEPDNSIKLPLAVNADELHLSAGEGATYIQVYSTGNWSVSFKEPVGWASIDVAEGKGNGQFLFSYEANTGIGRKAVVVLNKDEEQKEIVLFQSGRTPSLRFASTTANLPVVAAPVHLELVSNLVGDDANTVQMEIMYNEGTEEWITNVVIKDKAFEFYATENRTGATRSANVILTVANLNPGTNFGETTTANVEIRQTTVTPVFTVSKPTTEMDRNSGEGIVTFSTNLTNSLFFANFQLEPASAQEWISDLRFSGNNLNFNVGENQTGSPRSAVITATVSNQSGEIVRATHTVSQLITAYNYLSFEDIRAKISASNGTFSAFAAGDVLEGIVISNAGNPNMETNPNKPGSYNDIDFTENDKTAYVQTEDSRLGFRIKTVEPMLPDSKLKFSSKVIISLDGLTLEKEDAPTRYTLRGLTEAHVLQDSPGTGSVAVDKVKPIKELTDEDIYTLVGLRNTEISLPYGSYMNVRANFYLASNWNQGGSDAPALDAVPVSIRDDMGGHATLLTNAKAPWCRDPLPTGAGPIAGIIVHSKLKRFGAGDGDIGTYSIRVLSDADIYLNGNLLSTTIVEWNALANGTDPCSAAILGNLRDGNSINPVIGTGKMTPSQTLTPSLGAHAICNSSPSYTGTVSSALQFNTNWWDAANNTGRYVTFSFSTAGITGKNMTINFSQGGGNGTSNLNIPVYWQVEYSTDGSNFTVLPNSTYTVRPMLNSGETLTLYTVPGMIDHSFTLPDALFNRANVYVRLSAQSNICGSPALDGGESGTLDAASGNVNVRFGVVSFKYNQ